MSHILIADDESTLTDLVGFNLESAGFQVTVAHDGHEAWECAQHHQFDLVITDYNMPRMKGADLCRRLRGLDAYRETPIVMMTIFGCDLDVPRLRDELALAAVFPKPFNPSELVKVVEDLTGVQHAR